MITSIYRAFFIFLVASLLPLAAFCQLPAPQWVNDLGGSGDSKPTGMAIDNQNNIYVAGYFAGTVDFDPSAAVKNLTSKGGFDIYVAKFKPDGSLIWAESMGGNALDQVNCLTVDLNGNVTVAGQVQSSDLDADPGAGVFNIGTNGDDDIFLIHLNSNGSFLWAKSFGSSGTDRGQQINADNQGNVILTSFFQSNVDIDGHTFIASGGNDGLVVKFDAAGNYKWGVPISGNGDDGAFGNRSDSNGNIIISGMYSGNVNFNPLGAPHFENTGGSKNPYVAKFSPAGQLIWVKTARGDLINDQSVISIDTKDNIYFTAAFSSSINFEGTVLNSAGGATPFITKYQANGNLQFAKSMVGGSGYVYQTQTDKSDNVYFSGYFTGTIDFNPDPAVTNNVSYHGQRDFFLGKYDENGNYLWAFSGGSANCDLALGLELAVDASANVYLSGSFCSTVNFDPTSCSVKNVTAINGTSDSFVAKYAAGAAQTITNNIITPPALTTYCSGENPDVITGSTPTGGSGTYVYQWQSSTDNVTFSDIAGATAKDYDATQLTATTYYRRRVTSGMCAAPLLSNVVQFILTPAPANNTVTAPGPSTFCVNGNPTVIVGSTPTGGSGTYAYQWQISSDNTTFTNIVGATGKDYDPPVLNATTYYRRNVTSGGCAVPFASNIVTLTVIQTPASNTIAAPSPSTFCVNGDPALIVGSTPTGGDGTYAYQWQSSANNVTFTDIAAATAKDYDPPVINATRYYRRTVTSGVCNTPVVSNVVTLSVIPAVAGNTIAPPAVTNFCATGDPAVIIGSTPTGGSGSYVYQWQSSTDNLSFADIAGATLKDLDPAVINVTTYYRRIVTSGACNTPTASNVITITVLQAVAGNVITAPALASFCVSGNPANIVGSTPSGGSGSYSYKWQVSADNSTFTDIPGAVGKNYDPPMALTTTYYRRTVTSAVCNVPLISNVVTITITSPPATPAAAAAPAVLCEGGITMLSVTSPQAGLTYKWYDSPARTNLLFTGNTYQPDPLTSTKTFYVEAVNGTCISAGAGSVQVTVNPAPGAPAVVNNQVNPCLGTAATLSISSPQAGFVYKWYTTSTGGVPVFNGKDFNITSVTANGVYYAEAVNVSGCPSPRTLVTVTVKALPQVTAQGAAICRGSSATVTANTTVANGIIKWYADASGGSSIYTGSSYPTPVLNTSKTYYAEAEDPITGCISATRSPATVQMLSPLAAPVVSVGATTANSVQFTWNAVAGAVGYEISIDNGQTFSVPSSGIAGLSHVITGLQPNQSVTILVRAAGNVACRLSGNSTAVTASAIDPLTNQIFVANAFSPNGDGKNDVVYVHSSTIKSVKFYIYDQWGELLFSSSNISNGWDGTFKGNKQPVGVYVYYVQSIMNDGTQVNKKGTITLIR